MRFSTLAFARALALPSTLVKAAPTTFGTLDVFVPRITAPIVGDTWAKGSVQSVKWETSNAPDQISNPNGLIHLRRHRRNHFHDSPLAVGFSILDGEHTVTVPDVPIGPYQVVLFGGNWGPIFDIAD